MNTSNKYAFILAFFALLGAETSHAESCGINRFSILQDLLPITRKSKYMISLFKKKEIISRIEDIDAQLDIIPLSINGTTTNTQNFQDFKQSNQSSKQTNSIDLAYDLNAVKKYNLEKQSLIQKELLDFELSQLNSNELATVFEAVLEYLMGAELQKSYEIEKRYYEVKKDYFYERKEFGDLNLENLLEVDKELRNISDKILANSVKQIERLNFLNISEGLIPIKHNISDTNIDILNSDVILNPILL